jgi:hypothetical protein
LLNVRRSGVAARSRAPRRSRPARERRRRRSSAAACRGHPGSRDQCADTAGAQDSVAQHLRARRARRRACQRARPQGRSVAARSWRVYTSSKPVPASGRASSGDGCRAAPATSCPLTHPSTLPRRTGADKTAGRTTSRTRAIAAALSMQARVSHPKRSPVRLGFPAGAQTRTRCETGLRQESTQAVPALQLD